MQFTNKCDRLAQTLHQVVLRVVRIEGEDTPYSLPEKSAAKSGSPKEKLEQVLQHIVNTLDYVLNYMEDDVALLYLFCDMVAVAEGKKSPPEHAAKKVLFVVERAKRIQANLQRLHVFVMIKHNGPEPGLVQDLIALQVLRQNGFVTEDEYVAREMEVIENMVRAFVTKGRFLEQKEQHSLIIKREKPIEIPASMPEHLQSAVLKLKLLLDQSFIETNEYNVRASQIIARWQEERLREQEERARALKEQAAKNAAVRKSSSAAVLAPPKDLRWSGADAEQDDDKLLIPEKPPVVPVEAEAPPPPVPDFVDAPPPVPEFVVEEPFNASNQPAAAAAQRLTRVTKPLPTPGTVEAQSPPTVHSVPVDLPPPPAPLVPHTVSAPAALPSSPVAATPSSPATQESSADAAMAKLSAALQQQAAAKKAASAAALSSGSTSSPQLSRPVRTDPAAAKTPAGAIKVEKKRSSIFARVASPTPGDKATSSGSPDAGRAVSPLTVIGSGSSDSIGSGMGGGIFDDLSVLQMVAKQRNDADAYRIHAVEKKLGAGKKDLIQMKACIDKTYVSDGHSLTVKLHVANHSKKSVNCIKFILESGVDESIVNTVEDATRDLSSDSDDPIFPLIKRSWQGELIYMLPMNVAVGFYKLRVQLFYNTRYNIEVPIAVHVLSKGDMWQHNPLQVFGVPLDEVLRREGGQIPQAVSKTLEVLCDESCLAVEGIFRMSGDLSKISALRDEMDSGKSPAFGALVARGAMQGVHVVAGVMKLFFRMLPHPLLTEALYDDFLTVHTEVKNESLAAKIAAYKPLVARVPESSRMLFATLSDFLNRFVIPHNETNKMHHANLAVIFGPVFVWRANLSPMEELSNASRVNGCVKELFEAGRVLFPEVVALPGIPKSTTAGMAPPVLVTPGPIVPQPATLTMKKVASGGGAPNSPSVLRMGTNRRGEGSSNALSLSNGSNSDLTAAAASLNASRDSLKPLKPLPPIPRSAQLQGSTPPGSGAGEDDEEEEESSVS